MEQQFIDRQSEENNYLVCEVCGSELIPRTCKLKCEKCGYFRSCSDLF